MAKIKTYQTDIREARKKVKRKNKFKKLVWLAVLAAVLLIFVLTSGFWVPKLGQAIKSVTEKFGSKTTVAEGEFPISMGQTQYSQISTADDCLVVITDTHLNFYDKSGVNVKSVQHSYSNPTAVPGGNRILLYDLGGYNLIVANKKGEIFTKKTDEQIIMSSMSSSGYTIVVTQTEKYASYMTVYDSNGKEAFRWSSNQRVVDVSFNKSGDGCVVSSITADGGEIKSMLTGLSFSKSEPLFETQKYSTMIYKTRYCSDGNIWAVANTRLMKLNDKGEVLYNFDYDTNLEKFTFDGDIAAIVQKSVINSSFELSVMPSSTGEVHKYTANDVCKQITCHKGKVYVLMSKTLAVFDDTGACVASYDVSPDYQSFVFLDDNVYFMDYSQVDKVTLE